MKNLTYWALIAICGIVGFQGCGSSGGKAPVALTPRCILPSDCSGHLVCIDRYCVNECAESKDCTGGARCIAVEGGGNSCQPPEKKLCTLNSDCSAGLVCGVDQQCRNQCHTDVDCPKNQRCTASSLLCADPKTDTNYDPTTNEFKPTAGGTGGTVADGGGTGGTPVDGSSSDGPAPTEGGGTDAGPGIDAMGTVLDGVTVAPSKSVRPGQGNIIITITQTAGGLSNPTTFDLGGLTVHADA
ncbi:MAG TPA: hypothetical protein VNO55_29915, partial [Polyangia bacterium]|nr:hypothetical protein [Polyangia bacterium]